MASWLEANDLIYNKKVNAYKDFRKKDALWEAKAADMGKDVIILKTWYSPHPLHPPSAQEVRGRRQ